jgi:hypothetical protein
MARKVSPAQLANQMTFLLKGYLKNVQLSYIRAAAMLARIRDEKLYRALEHDGMENYAQQRLGLRRASLYRYLQIYDWLRKSHRGWLAKHPKGFIPELTDAYGLMWIEERLEDEHLAPETRKELEALRRKALSGKLTQRELDEFRKRGREHRDSLTAVNASLRAVRKRLGALPVSSALLQELDVFLDHLKAASGAVARVAVLGNAGGMRLAAVVRRSLRA